MSRPAGPAGITVDMISDTVTVPDARMRAAMAAAEVGDDVYAEDPTVRALESTVANLAGMEAGLFFPSGTMSNQAAMATHAGRGHEVVVPEGAHVYEYEIGAMSLLSGLTPRPVHAPGGVLDPVAVRAAVHRSIHQAPTGLVVLENTHNRAGGTVTPLERTAEIAAICREEGLPFHLDGARAFNAAVALGVDLRDVVTGFDTASICLSKGLGAPVGSVLVGSAATLATAHRYRKAFGGGMRQAGILAAAGLDALDRGPARLHLDHARARRMAHAWGDLPGVSIDLERVHTNIVFVTIDDAPGVVADLAKHGVRAGATGPRSIRFVTHHQIDDEALQHAIEAFTSVVTMRTAATRA